MPSNGRPRLKIAGSGLGAPFAKTLAGPPDRMMPLGCKAAISAAEVWKARIGTLIQQSGTVVVVITPGAVKSDILKWEVEQAIGLSKKIIPVEWLATPIADLPRQLAELNIGHFMMGEAVFDGLATVVKTMRAAIDRGTRARP